MKSTLRTAAAADAIANMATDYICQEHIWPVFAAWANTTPGSVPLPEDPSAIRAVRAILVKRSAESVLAFYASTLAGTDE